MGDMMRHKRFIKKNNFLKQKKNLAYIQNVII